MLLLSLMIRFNFVQTKVPNIRFTNEMKILEFNKCNVMKASKNMLCNVYNVINAMQHN